MRVGSSLPVTQSIGEFYRTKFLTLRKIFPSATCQFANLGDIIGEVMLIHHIILGSSVVERSTVNRLVAGSNPARGVVRYLICRELLVRSVQIPKLGNNLLI
jgi:hypothetical protein